jgi:hypothetical protein
MSTGPPQAHTGLQLVDICGWIFMPFALTGFVTLKRVKKALGRASAVLTASWHRFGCGRFCTSEMIKRHHGSTCPYSRSQRRSACGGWSSRE